MAGEYRDAERAGGFDVFKTFAKTNIYIEKWNGERDRTARRLGESLKNSRDKCESSRKKRFRTNERKNFADARQARVAETAWFYMTGDYEHRMDSMSPIGKLACFEFGDTDRVRKDFPVYIAKRSRFRAEPQGGKKGGE